MHSDSTFFYFLIGLNLLLLFFILIMLFDAFAEQKPIDVKGTLVMGLLYFYFTTYIFKLWRCNYICYNNQKIKLSTTNREKRAFFPAFTVIEIMLNDITEISLAQENVFSSPYLVVQPRNGEALIIDTKLMSRKVFRKIVDLCKSKGIKVSKQAEAV